MTPDTRKILSLLLIPVYLILIAVFLAANIKAAFNPPILLLLFNALFLGLIPLYVAYVAYISFRSSGSTGVLLKGTGMLVLGLGAIAAGIINYLPDSMNANITVQNTSFCAGALLQLIGILIALSGTVPQQRSDDGLKCTLLYGGSGIIVFFFSLAAVTGAIPPFFIPGVGFTPLREVLIASAVEFFALAAGILLWLYYREREDFFFWYSIGLALIGIGLVAVHFPSVLGSPLGWVGRSAQYLGGVYILIAFIALGRSARRTGIPAGDMLSRFFGEAETSYRALIETATDAIVVFDSADQVIVWNRAAERMFGYTPAEATGSSFFRMVIPDEFTTIIKNNFRGPVPPLTDPALQKPVEITARRKDGSTFPVELALSRHMVGDTRVSTCIIRDLTERRKADDALQNNIRLLEDVMEGSTSPIFLKDLGGRFISINSALERILGKSRQELKGKTDYDIAPKEVADSWRSHDKKVIDTGKAIQIEEVADLPDRQYTFLANKFPLVDAHGRIYGVGSISHDITERKKAEEALRESEERFRSVMDNSPVVIFRLNLQTKRYEYFSPACGSIYGYSPQEMIKMSANDTRSRVHPDDLSRFDAANTRIEEEGNGGYEVRWLKSSGEYRWLSLKINVMNDATGLPLYRNGFVSDVTERRNAEEALLKKNADLEILNEELNTAQEELQQHIGELTRAEAKLRESEARYRTLFETMAEGFSINEIILDDKGMPVDLRYLSVNPAFEIQTGLKAGDIIGRTTLELFPGAEPVWFERYGDVVLTGKPAHFEEKFGPLGRWFDCVAYKMGKMQFAVIFIDITERRQMEEKLQITLQRFYRILSNMQYGILLVTDENRTEFANQAFCDMFGLEDTPAALSHLSAEEMLEKIRPAYKDPDAAITRINEIVDLGQPVTDEDVNMRGGRTFLRAFTPIIVKGMPYGRLWIHVDITRRKDAEREIVQENEDLNAACEEIASKEEELRQNLEELSLREHELIKSAANLEGALAEKEALLSEIHHRVKNNLTSFISLLSLDGSYEETDAGRALRKDLQNRARSMALIHETLYRTGKFSTVDMKVYLSNLISQVAASYKESAKIRIVTEINEVSLDLARATTAGLIINELVTNSFKYAFPPGFDCMAVRKEPCTIRVALYREDGTDVLIVADNGCGLPAGLDPMATKSLGLKLVNFLACHQLRANIEVRADRGTEFIFRLKDTEEHA